uniref:Uncharacterized protein n=1 Tax=Ditylenchus dipsaci TaxID=166011 RepID=A0A915E0D5_9BILA
MLWSTVSVVSFADSSASLISYALVVFLFIFSFAPPMLVAQCCKKKTAAAKGGQDTAKPKVFGPADDVLLCKTQNETIVVDTDVKKPAAVVAPPPAPDANKPAAAAVQPSPEGKPGEVLPKSKEKTCLPATTNVGTVVPDPELKTRNVSLETVESREPQSAPIVKAEDKFINKGGGIFVDKDNKAISQYAPAPQNNG